MNRLYTLDDVVQRAKLHGIRVEHTQANPPTVSMQPCPSCQDGFDALAVWDGISLMLLCNGCDDPPAIRAALLAEPETADGPSGVFPEPPLIVPASGFAAIEEMGAASLVGGQDEALIPEGGDVLFYGDGGAGKTTLTIDLSCHLAAGDQWLGMPVARPVRVLLVENEGPRPMYRAKLRRKLARWTGGELGDRLQVLERPWSWFTFADEARREWFASELAQLEVDVVIIGPVSRSGMNDAGTLQEVRDFMALVDDVRKRSGRFVTFILVHHENKGGKVSGAWEGSGDTLLHVSGQGHGRTRLYVQKARWASSYHATTLNLVWTDCEGFIVEDKPEVTDDDVADRIVNAILADPGIGWTRVEEAVPGVGAPRRRQVRDGLFAAGVIVNVVKVDGLEAVLQECPERKKSSLYVASDPTIQHLRPDPDADGTQTASASGVGIDEHLRPASRPIRDAGTQSQIPPPPESLWRVDQ